MWNPEVRHAQTLVELFEEKKRELAVGESWSANEQISRRNIYKGERLTVEAIPQIKWSWFERIRRK